MPIYALEEEAKKVRVVYFCEECGKPSIRLQWEGFATGCDDQCDWCGEWSPLFGKRIKEKSKSGSPSRVLKTIFLIVPAAISGAYCLSLPRYRGRQIGESK